MMPPEQLTDWVRANARGERCAVVSTLDGRVLSGMIIDEGSTSLTLRNAQNVAETVLFIDVDEIKNTGMSIITEGFEDAMDPQAMADLIAYLLHSSSAVFACTERLCSG